MSVIRPEFHTSLATRTLEDILYARSDLFYFLGKIDSWGYPDSPPSQQFDGGPDSSVQDVSIRDNILYMQKVAQTDASLVVPYFAWNYGTVYTQWDDSKEMKGTNFYCITPDYNVYKCLYNNFGADSTVSPAGRSMFPFTTEDGYIWKYMFQVPLFKRSKFFSSNFIPVQRALSDTFFGRGAIEQIVITNGGEGYYSNQLTSITVTDTGHTTGSGATAKVASVDSNGRITGFTITNPGTDYFAGAIAKVVSTNGNSADITPVFNVGGALTGFNVTDSGYGYAVNDTVTISVGGAAFTPVVSQGGIITAINVDNNGDNYTEATVTISGDGKNAAAHAVLSNDGSISHIVIDNYGEGYTEATVVISGDGTGATADAVVEARGSIVEILIDNPGAGYLTAPTLSFIAYPGVGAPDPDGKYGNASAVASAFVFEGKVVNVTVEDPGINYPSERFTTLVVDGDGTGAMATPIIYNGEIIKVVIDNPGEGYSYATVTAVGAHEQGTGAEFDVVFSSSNIETDQSIVEQVAVPGAIYCIEVTEEGDHYSDEATVVITGDGTGATATPTIVGGRITQILMDSYGSGYTNATITFNDPNRFDPEINGYVDAQAYAILPPPGGHGSNAPYELYADTLAVHTALTNDTETSLVNQDYRQYGLILNPVDILNGARITTAENLISFKVTVGDVTGLAVDDHLLSNGKRYRLVKISGSQLEVQQLSSIYGQPSDYFQLEGTDTQVDIITIDEVPVIDKYSGDLMYVANHDPFTSTANESIAIKTYITF